ncbi:hypothetical protein N7520_006455 [Penicillium odoratum]|uniref:uncharacterized protein n=1 Tax=Penicillium odoratum TaxID=1167516 RepID=UPI00254925F0|nr:uncharacterized protein N7520_006455 [Penicillium odoratum]KAJ5759299.1 hypothetical protein N7520_006455 [Penicillium odoratum]
MAEHGLSRLDETTVNEEEQEETTSEQLLHRFMEVILLLFSIICDSRDEYRSTPGKVKRNMYVGGLLCDIEDDGYVYISRAGTSGHGPADDNREGRAPYVKWVKRGPKESKTEVQSAAGGEEEIPFEKPTEKKDDAIYMEVPLDEERSHVSSDRSRFGTVPIIRYETKRLNTAKSRDLNVFSQIFSQLLTAAEMNMAYLEDVDTLQGNWLTAALDKPSVSETTAKYHDAFVIHVIHHTLTIHTARFPKSYLDWIKTKPEGSNDDDVAPENFAILYKVSAEYDLSVPQKRLQAACDILILLWAIKHGKAAVITSQNRAESNIATEEDIATEYGPLFVARAVWKKDIKMKAANKDTKSTKIGDGSTSKNFLGLEIHGQKVDVPDGTSMHPIHHTGMEMCNTLPGSFDIVNDMGHH